MGPGRWKVSLAVALMLVLETSLRMAALAETTLTRASDNKIVLILQKLGTAEVKSPCDAFDLNKSLPPTEAERQHKQELLEALEQSYAEKLYDSARLPQPYNGVLSSDVLPAEGASRLTLEGRVDKIERSCLLAFLVDQDWGLQGLHRLYFRSINVDVFKDTASGKESTRIFFSVPKREGPEKWWKLYRPATLILGAFPEGGGDPIFSFVLPVEISDRRLSITGGCAFGVAAYLCAALAAWRRTGVQGRTMFSLNPVQITAGVLGGGSISQLQVFFFSLLIASMVFFLWLWTGLLSNISQDLLWLMGISSIGAVGAKYAASMKSRLSEESEKFLRTEGWFAGSHINAIIERPRTGDLLLTNNRLDVYKFQMAMFSIVVAVSILGNGATDLGQVKISETLLYLIGISQGVYISSKVVAESETSLNDRVKSLIDLKAAYLAPLGPAERDRAAADYATTATAAAREFEAITNIKVDEKKLRLA